MAFRPPGPKSLTSDDIAQRDILWLPPLDVINLKQPGRRTAPVINLTTQQCPTPEFYNHPILVISRPQEDWGKIQFLLLTTYSGQKLTKRFRGRRKMCHWQRNLALDPCEDHPLRTEHSAMYAPLTFEGGRPTDTEGYLNVSEVCEMQWQDVEEYWIKIPTAPARTRLDRASFHIVLMAVAKFAHWKPGSQLSQALAPAAGTGLVSSVPAAPGPSRSPFIQDHDAIGTCIHAQSWPTAAASLSAARAATESPHVRTWADLESSFRNIRSDREPLLPQHHARQQSTGNSYPRIGFWAWLWDYMYLKRERLRAILNFVSYGIFCS